MGFKVFINDDEDPIWESESEAMTVDKVGIHNVRGEVAVIGSNNQDDWIRVVVNERPSVETYLDLVEAKKLQERRDMFEKEAEGVDTDAYVKADEDGVPEERQSPAESEESAEELETFEPDSEEDQKKEEVQMGDVEF